MQTSQKSRSSGAAIHRLYHEPEPIEPFRLTGPHFQVLNNNAYPDTRPQESVVATLQTPNEQFFTLESSPVIEYPVDNSNSPYSRSPLSPQGSAQSCLSNLHHSSPEKIYGSPVSSGIEEAIREVEMELLGPGSDFEDGSITSPLDNKNKYYKILQLGNANLDVKQTLIDIAHAIDDGAKEDADALIEALQSKVSVTGDPIQRLGTYMLEGLRARQLSSGSLIYKKLRCYEPKPEELTSYMSILYEICPYYKFAYTSANAVIKEAMQDETQVHVIDFLIAQGSQWVKLIEDLAKRPGGPPRLRVTGVDDGDSSYARGGGLQLVGQKLAMVAEAHGVPFEFHAAAISGSDVHWGNLRVRPGEALAVNFPYMLHHMPDESVSTTNHRDRLIRLVKHLTPKVVTLLEQESNTNTSSFSKRFEEALDYYTAMFESIDAKLPRNIVMPRDDKQRISAEENCVARDMVNIVACEDTDRVERHEPLDKWKFRLQAAGFMARPLSYSAVTAVEEVVREYSNCYRLREKDGALVLAWKNKAMVTCSAWRYTRFYVSWFFTSPFERPLGGERLKAPARRWCKFMLHHGM
ncbi:putative transcription factor GRAS family [Helianthus annuus]|nr:putative transcription factor GRAS family [Helianthus annuus]KAJ0827246.1 putative transcription factor GRAS family [Helianthus annuus]